MDEPQPPLPPTSTHPLFKSAPPQQSPMAPPQQNPNTLNYSNSEAPKVGFYAQQQQHPQQHPQQHQQMKNTPNNPWDREEREKEGEMRRDQIRQWRDQQIVELSLLPSRTSHQEEQLKTLVLERDFERRALEEENEEENDAQYQKNTGGVQEVLRLQQPNSTNTPPSQIMAPTTRLKQVDIKTTPTNISPSSETAQSSNENHLLAPPIQPKSILKSTNAYNSNPSSPSKHGKTTSFAPKSQNLTEITINNTNANQMLTQLNKEMGELTIEYQQEETNGPMPPPPPERGSSFAVMHQQKVRGSGNFSKISFNDQMNNNNNNTSKYVPLNNNNEHSPMMSPSGTFTAHQIQQQMNLINNNNSMAFNRDNKRVSFHDHENNNVEIVGEQDFSMIREDPNVRT
jgi:afadin